MKAVMLIQVHHQRLMPDRVRRVVLTRRPKKNVTRCHWELFCIFVLQNRMLYLNTRVFSLYWDISLLCLSRASVEQLTAPKIPPGPWPSNSSAAAVQSILLVQYLLSATILRYSFLVSVPTSCGTATPLPTPFGRCTPTHLAQTA
jgi:hypothetical protein